MNKLSEVIPLDASGESTKGYGQAIGLANTNLNAKMATLGNRGVISSSVSIFTRTPLLGSTVYVCYINMLITKEDIA